MSKYTGWAPTQIHQKTGKRMETGVFTPDSDTNTAAIAQRVHSPVWMGLLLILILVMVSIVGYQTGIVETLGYESKTIEGGGFTSTESGYALGLKSMYFRQGQPVFAEYEAKVTSGSLVIRMYNVKTVLDPDADFHHRVESTGTGEVTFVVKESGWHHLVFEGSVLGKSPPESGYRIDYTIKWGIR